MDLRLYSRVLRRFWAVLLLGLVLAAALALLSYYEVSLGDGPLLTPRVEEVWQSSATVFLTEPGFAAGRTRIDVRPVEIGDDVVLEGEQQDPAAFTRLAVLYAKLAQSDQVARLILSDGRGPLTGSFAAVPTPDGTSDGQPLPMVTLVGTAPSAAAAQTTVERAKNAFVRYIRAEQARAEIPEDKRVIIETINEPRGAELVTPRKKTMPIAVFIAVLSAAIAVVFVLENLRPTKYASEPTLVEVRRSA